MNTHPASVTGESIAAAESLWLRILKSIAGALLLLALMVVVSLTVAGAMPAIHERLTGESREFSPVARFAFGAGGLFALFSPVIFMAVASRKKWLTGRFLLVAWILMTPVLVWLTWDEPALLHQVSVEDVSPTFPDAEKSYALLMEYSRQTPSEEAKAFQQFKPRAYFGAISPREPDKWRGFITQHREDIEADWTALAPQRRWLDTLQTFGRWGDLTPSKVVVDTPHYPVWRTLSQHACGKATLLAMDGKGDEAVDLLAQMLEAGRKLQDDSRSHSRAMIGVVIERLCLNTAAVVLDLGPVSPTARARLTFAMGPDNAAVMARRMVLMDYVYYADLYQKTKLVDEVGANSKLGPIIRGTLKVAAAFVFNRIATINRYGEHAFAQVGLAETRDLENYVAKQKEFTRSLLSHPSPKNLGGRLMLVSATPYLDRILRNIWETADLRANLRQRLSSAG
jgi:hypothetical protein